MSATQIIQELPKLTEPERRAIRQVLAELAAEHEDVQLCNQAALEGALTLDRMEEEDEAGFLSTVRTTARNQPIVGLLELLRARGFEPNEKRVKMMRHKDRRYDVDDLRTQGWFDLYQSIQKPSTFRDCDQVVAFIGEQGTAARFVGVYDIGPSSPAEQNPLPDACPFKEWSAPGSGSLRHELCKRTGFEDLEDRVIIDWGKGALAWNQWFKDKPVLEIRPQGRALPPFRDYLYAQLTFQQLRQLTASADAHRDWVSALSAVGGIYLVVNHQNGQQYVGSATGLGGLWQRWCNYAPNGHAGNERLRELCETPGTGCPEAFRFSILETFSRNLAPKEALRLESFFKEKLGSRAFGLNPN